MLYLQVDTYGWTIQRLPEFVLSLCLSLFWSSGGATHKGVSGQMSWQNTCALAATLAVKSDNNRTIHLAIFTALAGATNDLSMSCHEQRTGAAIVSVSVCLCFCLCLSLSVCLSFSLSSYVLSCIYLFYICHNILNRK